MILAIAIFALIAVGLSLRWKVGPTRVKDAVRLGMDLVDLVKLLATLRWNAARVRNIDWSVVDMFDECAASRGDLPAIVMVEPSSMMTYAQLDWRSNQVAHWAMREGLEKGDTVALVMPSCPDYVAMWLGMAKAGVCTALVNIHIKGPPLVHAIRTALDRSKSQAVVVDGSLANCVVCPDVLSELSPKVRVYVYGGDSEAGETPEDDMRAQLAAMSGGAVSKSQRRGITWNSTLLNVYTSGTTGLPKASKISHLRFFSGAAMFSITAKLRTDDRVYCALPLYHSSGGMLGVGGCWRAGCTLVIRARFSVRHFSSDCVLHRCTVVQYIGEVARYLVNSRETALDEQCCIRVAFGNGLSPDVWERLRNRYCIERIVEFYGSTEGNVNMVNNVGKVGAVGVIPWFAQRFYPILLLKVDSDQELMRDSRGRCIPCGHGEVGQLVGLINDRDPSRRFDGYTDASASKAKMVRHVLRPGDVYFASGDLLRRDAFGFYFWVDRMGDTFRWKGENVATTEVAQMVCQFPGIADVNVYGVEVPMAEGRVGMASIKFKSSVRADEFSWQELFGHLDRHLPSYSQPHFVRVAERPSLTSHMTTTFKHMKTQLRKEGFDPSKVGGDTLLFRDVVAKTFVPVTPHIYEAICTQALRL